MPFYNLIDLNNNKIDYFFIIFNVDKCLKLFFTLFLSQFLHAAFK